MQITLDLPDELMNKLLNVLEPEHFAQQAITNALDNFTAPHIQIKDDEDMPPADAFKDFIGCAEGEVSLSQNYKERLSQYWKEKQGYR